MKAILIKVAVILVIAIFLIGAVFFRKEFNGGKPKDPAIDIAAAQLNEINSNGAAKILENYVIRYNYYIYGDYSNRESLYPYMTDDLRQTEMEAVEAAKASQGEIPHMTIHSKIKSAVLENYDVKNNKVTLKIAIIKFIYDGAYIDDPANPGTQQLVDSFGNKFDGNLSDLLKKKETETYRVVGVRDSSNSKDWLVSSYQQINE